MGRPKNQVDLAKIRELHAKGYPDGEIAARMGLSRAAVVRARKEMGLAANRKRGERGPGMPKADETYARCAERLLKHLGAVRKKAWEMYFQGKIGISTAIAATYMPASKVPHPAPLPYAGKAENTTRGAAEKAVQYECRAAFANIAGVPGTAILTLARVYKTASPAEIDRLAEEAVLEAGYIGAEAKVRDVEKGVVRPVPLKQIADLKLERLVDAANWAPGGKLRKKRKFSGRTKAGVQKSGKKGKQGGIQDIEVRRAYMAAAGQ